MKKITHPKNNQKITEKSIRFSLLVASLLLIVFGILQGEARIVLQKAVLICLECIGIG